MLETHQRDASAANRALELLGRELNLFTEKKEVGKPGDFDHMADEELTEFIEAQGELVRELERQLLPPPPSPEAAQGCYHALGNAAPARCSEEVFLTTVEPKLPARSWLGLRWVCSRWRPACEGLSENRHQHTTNALATGADLDIRNELLRVGECSGKDIWMCVGEFGDGVQHQLKLAQFHRRF